MEECALGMEQRSSPRNAAVKDAPIELSKEECARSMGQRSSNESVPSESRYVRDETYREPGVPAQAPSGMDNSARTAG
eukprot:scaffold6316_cov113-Skeletonema_marinoi.AAC.1